MGVNIFLSALIVAIAMSGGNSAIDRKGKTSTETKKGGSSSSSSSKSFHPQQTTSKGSGKNSSNTAKDSTKENKSNNAYAAAAPFDNSKAGLQAVEVDLITGLEKDSIQAGLKKNRVWFQNYLADDLTGTNPDGVSEDKVKMMGRYLDPANVVESRTYNELNVRPYGEDVMIATGKISEKGRSNNASYDVQRTFIHVWVNRFGQWQQVAIQESPIQAETTALAQSAAPGGSQTPAPADGKP
jgi:Domain of unknown function (DUF4440)